MNYTWTGRIVNPRSSSDD